MSESAAAEQPRLPENFLADLKTLLEQTPAGFSEHELLQRLKEQGYFRFSGTRPTPPLELFQRHFLLFHALYVLRQDCLRQQNGMLEISPLKICLSAYHSGEASLTTADPLCAYYLDLANLQRMSQADVTALLGAFWRDYARFDNRAEALAELGLCDPVDEATIKRAYRRLAMIHHPDRGGEDGRLQAINAAYKALCAYPG